MSTERSSFARNPGLSSSLADALAAAVAQDKQDQRESPPPSRPPLKPAGRRKKAYKSTENISRILDDGSKLDDNMAEEGGHIDAGASLVFSEGGVDKPRVRKSRRPREMRSVEEQPTASGPKSAQGGWDLTPKEAPSEKEEAFMKRKGERSRRPAGDAEDIDIEDEESSKPDTSREKVRKHTTIGGGVEEAVEMIIPDLEEVQDDEMLTTVAAAPSLKVNRFKTIQELDGDLMASTGHLVEPPTALAGIDLSLLVSYALIPPDEVMEPDVHWDWEVIFTEARTSMGRSVTTDLRQK